MDKTEFIKNMKKHKLPEEVINYFLDTTNPFDFKDSKPNDVKKYNISFI